VDYGKKLVCLGVLLLLQNLVVIGMWLKIII